MIYTKTRVFIYQLVCSDSYFHHCQLQQILPPSSNKKRYSQPKCDISNLMDHDNEKPWNEKLERIREYATLDAKALLQVNTSVIVGVKTGSF